MSCWWNLAGIWRRPGLLVPIYKLLSWIFLGIPLILVIGGNFCSFLLCLLAVMEWYYIIVYMLYMNSFLLFWLISVHCYIRQLKSNTINKVFSLIEILGYICCLLSSIPDKCFLLLIVFACAFLPDKCFIHQMVEPLLWIGLWVLMVIKHHWEHLLFWTTVYLYINLCLFSLPWVLTSDGNHAILWYIIFLRQ